MHKCPKNAFWIFFIAWIPIFQVKKMEGKGHTFFLWRRQRIYLLILSNTMSNAPYFKWIRLNGDQMKAQLLILHWNPTDGVKVNKLHSAMCLLLWIFWCWTQNGTYIVNITLNNVVKNLRNMLIDKKLVLNTTLYLCTVLHYNFQSDSK